MVLGYFFSVTRIPFTLASNVFVIKSVAHDVPLTTIFQGVSWFLVADIIHLMLLFSFPSLSLELEKYIFNRSNIGCYRYSL